MFSDCVWDATRLKIALNQQERYNWFVIDLVRLNFINWFYTFYEPWWRLKMKHNGMQPGKFEYTVGKRRISVTKIMLNMLLNHN